MSAASFSPATIWSPSLPIGMIRPAKIACKLSIVPLPSAMPASRSTIATHVRPSLVCKARMTSSRLVARRLSMDHDVM